LFQYIEVLQVEDMWLSFGGRPHWGKLIYKLPEKYDLIYLKLPLTLIQESVGRRHWDGEFYESARKTGSSPYLLSIVHFFFIFFFPFLLF
jgi:hypothetical protein